MDRERNPADIHPSNALVVDYLTILQDQIGDLREEFAHSAALPMAAHQTAMVTLSQLHLKVHDLFVVLDSVGLQN